MVAVRVLGGLEARVAGVAVTLPADARARELLAWLAVHPGRHPRSVLAGRLRPDVAEESARKTLRDAIYRLRGALGPVGGAALITTREHVELDGVEIDLAEFDRLRRSGDLTAAVELADGALLAGLNADWVLVARDEHAAEVAGCLTALAERAEAAGDLAVAMRWARRRLEIEPLSEIAHREVIRLLALGDDRPAALAAGRVLTERLQRELGVPASAATRALIEDVRRGRVTAPSAIGEVLPAAAFPEALMRTAPATGRQPELARLMAAWNDTASRRTLRLALVGGEPGIGKTTLAGALARELHARDASILYGRSNEQALVPYQAWVEALEAHLHSLTDGEVEHWLSAHDGALARLLPTRGRAQVPAAGQRERYLAFETVRALLEDSARQRPMLLVLDDVHSADLDSLALLRHIVRSTVRARLLIVLCAREAELTADAAATVADLRRESPLVHVALDGLGEDAVAALLGQRAVTVGPGSARRYHRRTGGNPFFLDALLRDEQDGCRVHDGPPLEVRDIVARRLERLGPATRAALEPAAVIGVEFDLEAVAAAAGCDVGEILQALDAAIAEQHVAPAGPRGRYAFGHALVADTIVAALTPSRRARLHLRVAEFLGRRFGTSAGVAAADVARHLRGAGPLATGEQLADWEMAAAEEATAALAHEDAAAHYQAALAAQPQVSRRAQLLLALGHAQDRAGRGAQAREAFIQAAALAREQADAETLALASLGVGGLAVVIAAPHRQTTELLNEALSVVSSGDRATWARLRARLAVELYYADPHRAGELSGAAITDARVSGDSGALAAALNARRVALWDPFHVNQRLCVVDEMLEAAHAAGDDELALQARNWRVVDLMELGRLRDATAEIDAYEVLADKLGLPHYRWYVPLWRAGIAIVSGRWDDASILSERALALGEQADDPNAPLLVRVQREYAIETQRRFGDMNRDWIARTAAESPEPAPWIAWLAELDAATGKNAQARAAVAELAHDDFARLPMRSNWLAACELAEAVADLGDQHTAAALYPRLAPHAELSAVVARGVGCCNATHYYLGRLAATLGRLEEAQVHLRRAAAANASAGARPYAAATLTRLGEVLASGGEREQAYDTLADAIGRAETLQMPGLAAEGRQALQHLGR